MEFSVLMSCYRNDSPIFLKAAIESSFSRQTLKPSEFVIMVDGPVLTEIDSVLESSQNLYGSAFRIIRLPENKGLGNALRIGVEECRHEYIIRMDADDVSREDRFSKLIDHAVRHPEYSVIGSYTAEFEDAIECPTSVRTPAVIHRDIAIQSRTRSPVSHVSVLLKKSSVLEAGNYIEFKYYEDYFLWVRMMKMGHLFHNVPEILVYVRTDKQRYKRKGNRAYVISTVKFQKFLLNTGYISPAQYIINVIGRLVIASIPAPLRKLIYVKFLRKQP